MSQVVEPDFIKNPGPILRLMKSPITCIAILGTVAIFFIKNANELFSTLLIPFLKDPNPKYLLLVITKLPIVIPVGAACYLLRRPIELSHARIKEIESKRADYIGLAALAKEIVDHTFEFDLDSEEGATDQQDKIAATKMSMVKEVILSTPHVKTYADNFNKPLQ
jgi:hypothetical protein